jgi:hypothetical protein
LWLSKEVRRVDDNYSQGRKQLDRLVRAQLGTPDNKPLFGHINPNLELGIEIGLGIDHCCWKILLSFQGYLFSHL